MDDIRLSVVASARPATGQDKLPVAAMALGVLLICMGTGRLLASLPVLQVAGEPFFPGRLV